MAKEEKKELAKVESIKALSPFQEMEKRFEDFFRRPFSLLPSWWPRLRMPEIEEVSPSMDIFTDGDDVVVKTELPGMKKEDIDVSLTKDTITISGEKKKEEKVEKKDYYSLERSYGSFKRSFSLPAEVHTEKASAKFKDGILEIRIPKTEEAKKKEKKVLIE
ncbi:MAG: Hsp20/alpha crystallin family protein [Thermodesulfovibrionales bacterium]